MSFGEGEGGREEPAEGLLEGEVGVGELDGVPRRGEEGGARRTGDEDQYQKLRRIHGNAIPSMAISTIKHDGNGNPKRAKWRIVALGNLDPHNWSVPDCYAPVLSQYELRWFCSLSIHHQRRCKNLDVKQAFVQATIPEDEVTIVRPPPGCPKSRPNTYWLLKRTLSPNGHSVRHL